jgi:hypothetical protein
MPKSCAGAVNPAVAGFLSVSLIARPLAEAGVAGSGKAPGARTFTSALG